MRMANEQTGQILTGKLDRSTLWTALEECLRIGAEAAEFKTVGVLFGWAWGNDYEDWEVLELPWSQVLNRVREAEEKEYGSISQDDLFLSIGDDKFTFCHESDIHFPVEPVTVTGERICGYLRRLMK